MNSVTNSSDLMSLTKLTPSNCTEKMSNKKLQNVLKNHLSTMRISLAAIKLFQQGIMPHPLVGENACQIRAAIYTALAGSEQSMRDLAVVEHKLEDLIARISMLNLVGKQEVSLIEVLQENDLDLQVPSIVCPIVLGHILTVSKQSDLSIKKAAGSDLPDVSIIEANDPKKLEGFSPSLAKVLIKNARQSLSELSIQYLRDEAARVGMEGPQDVITDSIKLQTAPLLPGMQILLASMKMHRTAIVLNNRIIDAEGVEKGQVNLLFTPDGRSYQVVKAPQQEELERPAVIIEAVSISNTPRAAEELEAELIEVGIEPIILANCAAHPQFGGMSKNIEPPPSDERSALKVIAVKRGLCQQNPNLCRILHIFAGRVGGSL